MSAYLNSAQAFGRRLASRAPVLLVIIVLIALTALVMSARAWLPKSESAGLQTPATAGPAPERIESEHIVITPRGFEPAEIRRPKGRFTLMVDNRSGLREVEFQLDRVAGNRLHKARVPRETLDWSEVVDLTPGTYILTETAHPDWVCRFTITPN